MPEAHVRSAPLSVLVVDDDPSVRRALVRVLATDGWAVSEVATAKDALRHLARHPVDVLVCDQRMPSMTGIELLEIVRTRWPRTARCLLTANASRSDFAASVRAIGRGDVQHFLRKPWNEHELLGALRALRVPS
jgi:CheY-like chemotaxis protein